MGQLVDGQWLTDDQLQAAQVLADDKADGVFERASAGFRNWVTTDGAPGPSGVGGFRAEDNRYHLFAALNCPWAHRTLILRQVKSLESVLSVSLAAPVRTEQGWVFDVADGDRSDSMATRYTEPLLGLSALHQLYTRSASDYTGRVTVPVLWDKYTGAIVSNESADIVRMLNGAFNILTGYTVGYYPATRAAEIDQLNEFIYERINNGVYKAGFARTQDAYNSAVTALFDALDTLEALSLIHI